MIDNLALVQKPTLMFFEGKWCPFCKLLEPIVADIGRRYGRQVNVRDVDIADEPETVMQYHIQNVPTILIIKNGQVIESLEGLRNRDTILNKLGVV